MKFGSGTWHLLSIWRIDLHVSLQDLQVLVYLLESWRTSHSMAFGDLEVCLQIRKILSQSILWTLRYHFFATGMIQAKGWWYKLVRERERESKIEKLDWLIIVFKLGHHFKLASPTTLVCKLFCRPFHTLLGDVGMLGLKLNMRLFA
jgi:hypothetical protein